MARDCEKLADVGRIKGCRTCGSYTSYGTIKYSWESYSMQNYCSVCTMEDGVRTIKPRTLKPCQECIEKSARHPTTGKWMRDGEVKYIEPSDPCKICDKYTGSATAGQFIDKCPDDTECVNGFCFPVCNGGAGCDTRGCEECTCDDLDCTTRSCEFTCGEGEECIAPADPLDFTGVCTCTITCTEPNLPDKMRIIDDNGVDKGCQCGCQLYIDGCGTNEFGEELRFVSETCECVDDYASSSSLNIDLLP